VHDTTLTGRVFDPATGRGAGGLRVEVWSAPPHTTYIGTTLTRTDGTFTLNVRETHTLPPTISHDGDELAALTPREQEVLRLLAEGCSNREIAEALYIAPRTASTHVGNILQKLGLTSRTAAAARALQRGFGTAGRENGVAAAN